MAMLCQVLLFEQEGCASCKASYRELSKYPNIEVKVININRDRDRAKAYGVFGAPLAVFVKEGREIGRVYGYMPPLFKDMVDKCSQG